FVESYKYYVTQVCTICGDSGDPIPIWEVRLCRFCIVRQLVNKSALYAYTLTAKEIEVLKSWKTYVYDLGMHCTFYLRTHLDHLRRQKYSDPQIALDADVEKRQSERFEKENLKRKRKQREQEDSYIERTAAVLQCFKDLRLKADLAVMEEWCKTLRKTLDEIMQELRQVVVPRVERLMDLNHRLL
ncbi:24943_t:CDS:2, partial [Dentiscutata erythropus]